MNGKNTEINTLKATVTAQEGIEWGWPQMSLIVTATIKWGDFGRQKGRVAGTVDAVFAIPADATSVN